MAFPLSPNRSIFRFGDYPSDKVSPRQLRGNPTFVHHSNSSRQMPSRIFTSVISERAVNYGELISSLSFAVAKGDYRITYGAEGYCVQRKSTL
ncbi:hypothetical protein CDAR_93291 [Caerostris darwini]|uniref:Uncharacterized protein n=1 Tax=Caerostris darwini TaxID=1538125 RepID=A0AAV4UWV3_9ARAC|nr:hypothetical protein CDAR_93291 [Caerostris darwini]